MMKKIKVDWEGSRLGLMSCASSPNLNRLLALSAVVLARDSSPMSWRAGSAHWSLVPSVGPFDQCISCSKDVCVPYRLRATSCGRKVFLTDFVLSYIYSCKIVIILYCRI